MTCVYFSEFELTPRLLKSCGDPTNKKQQQLNGYGQASKRGEHATTKARLHSQHETLLIS